MNRKIDLLEQAEYGEVTEGDYGKGNCMGMGETTADRVTDGENDFGRPIPETEILGGDPVRTLDARLLW